MHAALPHKVVVHVHSVNAIAWAVRRDALIALKDCLDGFSWQWIPYTLSGMPLAKRVREACRSNPKADVFILGNHGLVVCGENCDHAERLLARVEKRLHLKPRPLLADSEPPGFSDGTEDDFKLTKSASIDALSGDVLSRTILSAGALYPCQILFLASTVLAGERLPVTQVACSREHTRAQPTPESLDKDRALCGTEMTRSQRELLFGLEQVVRRIYEPTIIRYLSANEVSEILQVGGQYLARAKREQRQLEAGSVCVNPW